MRKKTVSIATTIVCLTAMISILGCSVGRAIVKGPPSPTATSTPTRRPTFTPTASLTPTFTRTSTPTSTATPLAMATNPSVASALMPTSTTLPRPAATQARRPAPSPQPTETPVPIPATPTDTATPTLPYGGTIVAGFPNCGSTGVFGFIRDTNQQYVSGVYVRVWTDKWEGMWSGKSKSEPFGNKDRNYEVTIGNSVVPGTWHVAVVNGKNSKEPISSIIEITSSQNCEGPGAVQWTQVDFTKFF